jgi:hypothetical protein
MHDTLIQDKDAYHIVNEGGGIHIEFMNENRKAVTHMYQS